MFQKLESIIRFPFGMENFSYDKHYKDATVLIRMFFFYLLQRATDYLLNKKVNKVYDLVNNLIINIYKKLPNMIRSQDYLILKL